MYIYMLKSIPDAWADAGNAEEVRGIDQKVISNLQQIISKRLKTYWHSKWASKHIDVCPRKN